VSERGDSMQTRWVVPPRVGFGQRATRKLCEVAFELAGAAAGAHGGVRPFVVWCDHEADVHWKVPPATEDGRVLEAAYAEVYQLSPLQLAGVVDHVVMQPSAGEERDAVRVTLICAGATLGVVYGTWPAPGEVHAWFEASAGIGDG
jgi:hypothetical protein